MLARLCEEFTCVPSVAWRELQRLPAGLLEEILEARHYARAKAAFDAAETPEAQRRLPETDLMIQAKLLTFERAAERLAAAHG